MTICPTLPGQFWFMLCVLSSLLIIPPFTVSSALRDYMMNLKNEDNCYSPLLYREWHFKCLLVVSAIWVLEMVLFMISSTVWKCAPPDSAVYLVWWVWTELRTEKFVSILYSESLGFMLYFRNGINSLRVFRLSIKGRAHQINLPVFRSSNDELEKLKKRRNEDNIYFLKSTF